MTIEEKGNSNNSENIPVVLDEEKNDWLRYFSGLKSDPALYEYIKKLVVKIPMVLLRSSKHRMRSMSLFEFKNI